MIKPLCDRCLKELEEPGALAFSPPDENDIVQKWHICVSCWGDFLEWSSNYDV